MKTDPCACPSLETTAKADNILDDVKTYCPLDLYSGSEERMHRAIAGLWASWEAADGAGNNWRVYIDGKRVDPNVVGACPCTRYSILMTEV
jgi:hypothetical protein